MRELYSYVWRSSASRQIVPIILAVTAALLAMAPLELQRHIVNTLAGHEKTERLLWLCGAYLSCPHRLAMALAAPRGSPRLR
jgi:hypothetical protein